MNINIYLFIFIAKIIENAINTLRLIVVANGKKWLGAILMFVSALIWVAVTSIVVKDLTKDIWKIIFFALGSFFGSYAGSLIEQKIALGNNLLTIVIKDCNQKLIEDTLQKKDYTFFIINNNNQIFLQIVTTRKKRREVISLIKNICPSSFVVAQKVLLFN